MTPPLSADRISGLVFLLAGLAMIFGVISAEVEMVDGGNIAPSTLPVALSAVLALGGGVLLARPIWLSPADIDKHHLPRWRHLVRGLGIVLVLAVALAAMSDLGFMVVAPALALTLMWISGERRWHWFAIGAGLVPAAIWVFVVQILGRQLI